MLLLPGTCAPAPAGGVNGTAAKVLILVEGSARANSFPLADGRQLAALLGHFSVTAEIRGVDSYRAGTLSSYDVVFYIGFTSRHVVPAAFMDDALDTSRTIVWLNTGFAEFSRARPVADRLGFSVLRFDSTGGYDRVEADQGVFTKDDPVLNIVSVAHPGRVHVLATARASRTGRTAPYIVSAGRFLYVADSPFAYAGPTDRYLLFADLLHDILGEAHEESHSALVRIEDVNPLSDPGALRDIADMLSARGVPFLVGVSPFYVDPGQGLNVPLGDKPDLVDALQYMVRNGGTIVMHGVTHQYRGVTGADWEFWDAERDAPIREENADAFRSRIASGIEEFMRNGLYPMLWETPHYAGSFLSYRTAAEFFGSATEQRLAIEHSDYSQFFPYAISRDLFGQRLYPENLGYVPLDRDPAKNRAQVAALLEGAKANLAVRDGFAAFFFHPFVEPALLAALVDGIQGMGYTFIDLREEPQRVVSGARAVLTGNQEVTLTLDGQYLTETVFDRSGDPVRVTVSPDRLTGPVRRRVQLQSGEFYVARPTEYREREETGLEQALRRVEAAAAGVFGSPESRREARPLILWNHHARGALYNDQASIVGALRSVTIPVETLFVGQPLDLSRANLLIVPFASVDSLSPADYTRISQFVEDGGAVMTDGCQELARELGIRFSEHSVEVRRITDRLFPNERIVWRHEEVMRKIETDGTEEVLAVEGKTGAPVVVGRSLGAGKVLFYGTFVDPQGVLGTGRYPFFVEHVRRFLKLGPVVRRESLEMFFDPGFRTTLSVEQLVKMWVGAGIRRLHAAGWHQYPKYTYDYARLIDLAHANGILVYLWLEPPQVSQRFWQEHPEWREKNLRGEDVRPSWRYPVALTDSACVDAMTEDYAALLATHDWDGVNLAELYFEAGRGFDDPHLWTPMHPSARNEVLRRHGFDLRRMFDPRAVEYWKSNAAVRRALVEYRIGVLDRVYGKILGRIAPIAASREGFEVMVTAMDSYHAPEMREFLGVDMDRILALQRRHGFRLIAEDPQSMWSGDPLRYVAMGDYYRRRTAESAGAYALDLNILTFRSPDEVTPFPTLIQTGTEAFHLVNAAAQGAPRAAIYAESSVNPQDLHLLPFAWAAGVRFTPRADGADVSAPYSFVLQPASGVREIAVDGMHLTPVRDNLYLIPAGDHQLTYSEGPASDFDAHGIEPRIMSITGNLLGAAYTSGGIRLTYEADGRCLLSVSREPTAVTVDGRPHAFLALKGIDCYTIALPSGRHDVALVTGDRFTQGVSLASFWSSTSIVLFGLAAAALLVLLYAASRLLRRRRLSRRASPLTTP
jgi:uncharacterized protein YdaL